MTQQNGPDESSTATPESAARTDGDGTALCVVIPTRNRADRLDRLLDVLLADPATTEVVVVDDGSTDRTAALLAARRDADARVVPVDGPRSGPLAARVRGAQQARGRVVLLLDDDVLPDADLVSGHLARHAARPGEDLCVLGWMPTRVPPGRGPEDFTTALYAAEYEGRCASYEADPAYVLTHLWMGNVSVGRDLFLRVCTQWDRPLPRYRHEDTEIGLRLASLGVVPVFDRGLHGVHEHRRTLAQFRSDCRGDGAGLRALEDDHASALGESGRERFRAGLPRPLAAVVGASARPGVGVPVAAGLALGVRLTGALRLWGPQTTLARLLRRVEQQTGYLDEGRRAERPAADALAVG